MTYTRPLPEWVTKELVALRAGSAGQAEILAIVDKIRRADLDLQTVVWTGLGKTKIETLPARSIGKLFVLHLAIRKAVRPRFGYGLLTPAEAKHLAKKLNYASESFTKAMADLKEAMSRNGPPGVRWMPMEIEGALEMAIAGMLHAHGPAVERKPGHDEGNRLLVGYTGNALADHLAELVEAVGLGAKWWSDSRPPLDKPNHPTADRTYFIRVVSESFVHHFNAPLRKVVLALTEIWFGRSNLSENYISEIARVEDLPALTPRRLGTPPKKRPPPNKS